MAMNEELLASIDDRLMQLVEEMKRLTALLSPGAAMIAQKLNDIIAEPEQKITRRLGLSPEKKRESIGSWEHNRICYLCEPHDHHLYHSS